MQFKRNSKGEYRKRDWTSVLGMVAALFAFLALLVGGWATKTVIDPNLSVVNVAHADVITIKPDRLDAKVAQLKDDVVEQIGKCESGMTTEPDAALILDTNGEMSIGLMQFQIKTIQMYAKKFYGKAVSRTEAINIAIDHQQSHDLARDILFKEGGAAN